MTVELHAVCVAAEDPPRLGRFWAGLLGWALVEDPRDGVVLLPGDGTGFRLRFLPTREPKTVQNLMHLDLTSTSPEDQQATVARALALGARHVDVGQGPDAPHVVLADPEGDEFCVIEPGNRFLAGCGFVGALACDGSPEVGYFWSAALGWPLVWDQDQETAIRSPHGGPKLTWGGPPMMPRSGRPRLHLELALATDGHRPAEVERLLSLGATLPDPARPHAVDDSPVELADPDGNPFWLRPGRPGPSPGR